MESKNYTIKEISKIDDIKKLNNIIELDKNNFPNLYYFDVINTMKKSRLFLYDMQSKRIIHEFEKDNCKSIYNLSDFQFENENNEDTQYLFYKEKCFWKS